MEREIREFISYLHNTGKTSYNTEVSYQRDLKKMTAYLKEQGLLSTREATAIHLHGYLEEMQAKSFAASSISRSVASIRAYYQFLAKQNRIAEDPSIDLKAPKVEKKAPEILTDIEIRRLLSQPDRQTPKGLRDSAMLELLCATGLRVSELIHLKVTDVNIRQSCIVCHEAGKVRNIPITEVCKDILVQYMKEARMVFLKTADEKMLFTNCSGGPMSRQGFWKILKYYADYAGIEKDITPHTLRHSYAVHMLQSGTNVQEVRKLMGHSDISTTMGYLNENDKYVITLK